MAAAAAAAKADAQVGWGAASLAPPSAMRWSNEKIKADAVVAADNFIALYQQQQPTNLQSAQFLSPTPPSPQYNQNNKSLQRRIEPSASPVLFKNSSPVLRSRVAPGLSEAGEGCGGSEAVAPPPTPCAKPFVRREALQRGGNSQQSAARRVSCDSPVIAPLHAHDSPMSSASSQVSQLMACQQSKTKF